MNFKLLTVLCAILLIASFSFAAAPTVSSLTITPSVVTTDKNYVHFPISFYVTASGDVNADYLCWYAITTGGNAYEADWNGDTNRCSVSGYTSAGKDDFNFSMIVQNKTLDANGTSPLSYTWRDNNAPVSTATGKDNRSSGILTISATDIASDAIGAFGLMTKDSTQLAINFNRINDVMAATMTRSNTSMEDLFESIKN
jgi:hypothetical protein